MPCAPVYREPEEVRRSALEALDTFESLDPQVWAKGGFMPLKKNGSFHYEVRDKRSFGVCFIKTVFAVCNLVYPARLKMSSEVVRVHFARRSVLIALLMHTLLWMRDGVINDLGERVKPEDKRVLSPDSILNFIKGAQNTDGRYHLEKVRDLLEKMPVIAIPRDTSHWTLVELPILVKVWDMEHFMGGDLWCKCNLPIEKLKEKLEALILGFERIRDSCANSGSKRFSEGGSKEY